MESLPPSDRPETFAELIGPPPTAAPNARYTPGVLGYLIALLIADVVAALVVAIIAAARSGSGFAGLWESIPLIPPAALIGLVVVAPVSIPGIVLVHLLVRRQPTQWVHILAFGLLGGLAGFVGLWIFFEVQVAVQIIVPAAIGGAVGRWAVMRLIRRQSACPGHIS